MSLSKHVEQNLPSKFSARLLTLVTTIRFVGINKRDTPEAKTKAVEEIREAVNLIVKKRKAVWLEEILSFDDRPNDLIVGVPLAREIQADLKSCFPNDPDQRMCEQIKRSVDAYVKKHAYGTVPSDLPAYGPTVGGFDGPGQPRVGMYNPTPAVPLKMTPKTVYVPAPAPPPQQPRYGPIPKPPISNVRDAWERIKEEKAFSGALVRGRVQMGLRTVVFSNYEDVKEIVRAAARIGSGVTVGSSSFSNRTGLFAARLFPAGSFVTEFDGHRVDGPTALQLSRDGHSRHLVPLKIHTAYVHGFTIEEMGLAEGRGGGSFATSNVLYSDTIQRGSIVRCPHRQVNAEIVVVTTKENVDGPFDPSRAHAFLLALVDVPAGTELFVRQDDTFSQFPE